MSSTPLWAPWRMELLKDKTPKTGCIFCELPKASADRENLIVHRGTSAFVILNKYPYNNGHLMVVPHRHLSDFEALPPAEGAELLTLAQRAVGVLRQTYRPDGYNMGMNLGVAAGAGIADHLHWHVVPRWNGDTNFLPVLGDVKSMPQHLLASYDDLRTGFERGMA